MDRVERDVAVSTDELHLNHDAVVDMIQVIPYVLLGVSSVVPMYNQVAARTLCNLASNMAGENELPVVPLDLNLPQSQSLPCHNQSPQLTRLFLMYKSCLRTWS